jgi:hypothetical protein
MTRLDKTREIEATLTRTREGKALQGIAWHSKPREGKT